MRRREKPAVVKPGELPPELAMGPCIEVWAEPGASFPLGSARIQWKAAVVKWATAHNRDPGNAPNLARTRIPWSREALIANDRLAELEYLETGRGEYPKFPGSLGDAYWRSRISTTRKDTA